MEESTIKGFLNLLTGEISKKVAEKYVITSKEVLTASETAVYLGVTRTQLHMFMAEGEIPFYSPIDGKSYFKRSELEQWLLRNRYPKR